MVSLMRKVVIHTGDEFEEIANNLNALFEQTRGIISNVKDCSTEIYDVAENVDGTMGDAAQEVAEIDAYLQNMSRGVAVAASSLSEIQEMTQTVDLSEKNRKQAENLSTIVEHYTV